MAPNYFIHGNAVTVAERPGDLENINGIAWTDVVALRQGWGTSFRGKGGEFIWFHIPFPTLMVVNDIPGDMARVEVLFDIEGDAVVDSIHLWGSIRNRWFAQDDLGRASSWRKDFPRAVSCSAYLVSRSG